MINNRTRLTSLYYFLTITSISEHRLYSASLPQSNKPTRSGFLVTMPFQQRVDYSAPNKTTTHLLRESCRQGDLARVQELLLDSNANNGSWTLGLRDAATHNHVEVVRFLLDRNVVIDYSVVEEAHSIEAFKLLLEHGLDVHQILGLQWVPLMYVVSHLPAFSLSHQTQC